MCCYLTCPANCFDSEHILSHKIIKITFIRFSSVFGFFDSLLKVNIIFTLIFLLSVVFFVLGNALLGHRLCYYASIFQVFSLITFFA